MTQGQPQAGKTMSERFIEPCAYCGVRQGLTRDHVMPKHLVKRLKRQGREIPAELTATVACCLICNLNKSTRKLVPPSWEDKIPALREVYNGKWRVWRGDNREQAFSQVHV